MNLLKFEQIIQHIGTHHSKVDGIMFELQHRAVKSSSWKIILNNVIEAREEQGQFGSVTTYFMVDDIRAVWPWSIDPKGNTIG